jgi:hypothetical protein
MVSYDEKTPSSVSPQRATIDFFDGTRVGRDVLTKEWKVCDGPLRLKRQTRVFLNSISLMEKSQKPRQNDETDGNPKQP